MKRIAIPILAIIVATLLFGCKQPPVLSILTYNLSPRPEMADSTVNYYDAAHLVRRSAPDIVAVQYVDFISVVEDSIDVITLFKDVAYMESGFTRNVCPNENALGVGILTENSPLESWSVPLPGKYGDPVALVHEYSDCVFICAQFSVNEDDQMESVALMDSIAAIFTPLQKPVFVGGSLFFSPNSQPFIEMGKNFTLLSALYPTYPAIDPQLLFDYLWGYTGSGVIYEKIDSWRPFTSRRLMHLPVITVFSYQIPKVKKK